jgi:hypothetical protein
MTGTRIFVTDEIRRDRNGRRIARHNRPFVGDDWGTFLPPHPAIGLQVDNTEMADLAAFLRDKLGDEDCAIALQMLREAQIAQDEPNAFPGQPRTGGKMVPMSYPRKASVVPKKSASDAAAIFASQHAAIREFNEIRDAENEVRPFVGEVMGCDSAGEVYRQALHRMGVNTRQLPGDACKAAFGMARNLGARPKLPGNSRDFLKRFPEAVRIGQ